MKTFNLFFTITLALIVMASINSCSSDDFIEEQTNAKSMSAQRIRKGKGIDFYTDSIATANFLDSIANDSIMILGSTTTMVDIITEGTDKNNSHFCSLSYKGMTLEYRSIPNTFYPPETPYGDNGEEIVWTSFGYSGFGKLLNCKSGYRYAGKSGNKVTVLVGADYSVFNGITTKSYRDNFIIGFDGSNRAGVRHSSKEISNK